MVYYSTEQVEQIAQELAQTSLSGQKVSLSGYTSDITERYGQLMSAGTKSVRAGTYVPSEREQTISWLQRVNRAKGYESISVTDTELRRREQEKAKTTPSIVPSKSIFGEGIAQALTPKTERQMLERAGFTLKSGVTLATERQSFAPPKGKTIYEAPKEKIGKPGETYDTQSGMFISESQGTGGRGTLVMRKPTYQESLQLGTVEQREELPIDERTGKPYGTYTAIERQKGLAGTYQTLQEQRSIVGTKLQREQAEGEYSVLPGLTLFGIGFASSVVGTGLGIKELITHPLQSISNIGQTIYGETKSFFTTGQTETGRIMGETLRTEPQYATGYVAAELGQTYLSAKMPQMKDLVSGIWTKKPYQITPTSLMEETVEPFTRKRATLLLQESDTGKYILGKTKTGDIISIGGGIEDLTPKKALLKELREETGLKLSDISDLKFKGKVVFPEETHFLYTASINDFGKLKASSDIKEFVKISPLKAKTIFGKDITGQTALYPISKKGIRSYELGLISYVETGKKPTWLVTETPYGKYFLGTQSRYNVPYSSQKLFMQQKELKLASLSPKPITSEWTLRNIFPKSPKEIGGITKTNKLYQGIIPIRKEATILGSKTKRGAVSGLYLQPPTSIETLTSFQRKGAFLKSIAGEDITLFKGSGKIGGEGYFGLSYAGFGKTTEESLGLRIGFGKKRMAYVFKEQPKFVSITPKTISGMEEELIIQPGNIIKTTGRAKAKWLEGKRLFVQQTEIVKSESLSLQVAKLSQNIPLSEKLGISSQLKKATGIDYTSVYGLGKYTYVSPTVFTSFIPKGKYSIQKSEGIKTVEIKSISFPSSITKVTERKEAKKVYYGSPTTKYSGRIYKNVYTSIITKEPPRKQKYGYGGKVGFPFIPYYPYEPPRKERGRIKTKPLYIPSSSFKSPYGKRNGSFTVFSRRFGKWKPLSVGVSLEKAFQIGKSYTGRTLGVSFGIKKQSGSYRGKAIIPGYYSKLSKTFGGQIYIEKKGRRLKRGTMEIPEIQYYRKAKSKGGLY